MPVVSVLTKNSTQPKTASSSASANIVPVMTRSTPLKTTKIASKPVQKPIPPTIKPQPEKTPKSIFEKLQKAASDAFNRGKNAQTKLSNKELNKKEGLAAPIGRKLQQTPNPNLGTKGKKLFKATDTEEKIMNFISNFPSAIAQSYGKSLETLATPKGKEKLKADAKNLPKTMAEIKAAIDKKDWGKAVEAFSNNSALTIGLDLADFIPAGFLAKKGVGLLADGVKSSLKSKTAAKQIVKEALEETAEKTVKVAPKVVTKVEKKVVVPKPKTPKNVANAGLYDTGKIPNVGLNVGLGDTPLYHGSKNAHVGFDTNAGIKSNQPIGALGTWFSDNIQNARNIAGKSGQVVTSKVALKKPKVYEDFSDLVNDIEKKHGKMWTTQDVNGTLLEKGNNKPVLAFRKELEKQGYDGLIVRRSNGAQGAVDNLPDTQVVAFSPKTIRKLDKPSTKITKSEALIPSTSQSSNLAVGTHKGSIPQSHVVEQPIADIKPKTVEIPGKVSGVAKQIDAKAIEKGMVDKGYNELAVYDSSTIKAQSKIASKYSIDDINDIATGKKALPKELKAGTPLSIAEDYAIKNNDTELMRKLAKSPLATQISESASELSLSRMRNSDSPIKQLADIIKVREEAFKKRHGGKSAQEMSEKVFKNIQKRIKKTDKYDWNNFVKSLPTC